MSNTWYYVKHMYFTVLCIEYSVLDFAVIMAHPVLFYHITNDRENSVIPVNMSPSSIKRAQYPCNRKQRVEKILGDPWDGKVNIRNYLNHSQTLIE